MKTAVELISLLDAEIVRLKKLKDEPVGGFFFIMPPDGDPISNLFLGSSLGTMAFFEYLANKLKEAQRSPSNDPYVGLQGMTRGR